MQRKPRPDWSRSITQVLIPIWCTQGIFSEVHKVSMSLSHHDQADNVILCVFFCFVELG